MVAGLGLAAVGGAVIRPGIAAVVFEHDAPRLIHGLDAARLGRVDAAEHLVVGGVGHVVNARGGLGADAVGARGDRLRL